MLGNAVMLKTVLALLSGSDCDKSVLSASLRVAGTDNGHIECLRLMPDPADVIAQVAQVDMGSWGVSSETFAVIEQEARRRTEVARANFDAFRQQHDLQLLNDPPSGSAVTVSWREEVGDEFDRVNTHARYHDVVVLAGGHDSNGRLPEEALGGIIIGSGRPVLMAPAGEVNRPFNRIAIAWKETAEAARAITAAMPLLQNARQIDVLSVCEENKGAGACINTSDALTRYFRWHGLNASGKFLVPEGRAPADAALEHAQRFDADLLVMGAYGHSRVREFIFGGFTQRVLRGAELPILLFH